MPYRTPEPDLADAQPKVWRDVLVVIGLFVIICLLVIVLCMLYGFPFWLSVLLGIVAGLVMLLSSG